MKIAQKSMLRIKDILKKDKENVSRPLLSLIKSDFFSVMNRYFEVNLEDVFVSYYVGEDNKYHFEIKVTTNRLKKLNFLGV